MDTIIKYKSSRFSTIYFTSGGLVYYTRPDHPDSDIVHESVLDVQVFNSSVEDGYFQPVEIKQ